MTIQSRVFQNAERVRTCNSVVTQVPGMFASINNVTDPATGDVVGYISNAGIPSIANQTVQELDVITPYSVFPTVLFDKGVGMAWWRNMAIAKKMQSQYCLVYLPTKPSSIMPLLISLSRHLWKHRINPS